MIRIAAIACLAALLAGCSCSKKGDPAGAPLAPPPVRPVARMTSPALPPMGTVAFGPRTVSDEGLDADGLSAALGVGQAAIVWIEQADPGADVRLARVAGATMLGVTQVTRGTSSYAPTAVAWTGKDFVLAWGDDRFRHIEIFVARVSDAGKVVLAARRLTDTEAGDGDGGMASTDSSQSPALAYYDGQLIAAWGGPGPDGSQQAYHTTLSATGKPDFDPTPLTSGPSDTASIRLSSHEKGAVLTYCVRAVHGSELYMLLLAGTPPAPVQPLGVATSDYIPCSMDHVSSDTGSFMFWVRRDEDEGGGIEDVVVAQPILGTGAFDGAGVELAAVRPVKFPGKHRMPFDAMSLGSGRIAVAWVHREHDGSVSLKVGLFDESGSPLSVPLLVPTLGTPADPHLVGSGQPQMVLLAWLDRPAGSQDERVLVAGLEL